MRVPENRGDMEREDARAAVFERYLRFARSEAPGRSALYAEWAAGVAKDHAVADILSHIPAIARQPPLVFAVTRMLGAPEAEYPQWADWVRAHAEQVIEESSRRRLQTNEPLRCAALVLALCDIPGPLALIELGASAGLCLYPDRYSYRYTGGGTLDPVEGSSPLVLNSEWSGEWNARWAMPDIVWRTGIDLMPLDATNPEDRCFLTALVWPGEEGRRERIIAALNLVAADPPNLLAADASDPDVLRALVAQAPTDATVVITTPGVLPYLRREARERLLDTMAELNARWVSIDPPGLHDRWNPPLELPLDPHGGDGFVLARDGRPLARVDPLGESVQWLVEPDSDLT